MEKRIFSNRIFLSPELFYIFIQFRAKRVAKFVSILIFRIIVASIMYDSLEIV